MIALPYMIVRIDTGEKMFTTFYAEDVMSAAHLNLALLKMGYEPLGDLYIDPHAETRPGGPLVSPRRPEH